MKKIILSAIIIATLSMFSFKMAEEKQFYSYQISFTGGDEILYLRACSQPKHDGPNLFINNDVDLVFRNGQLSSPHLVKEGSKVTVMKVIETLNETTFNEIYNNFDKEELLNFYNSSSAEETSNVSTRVGQIIGIKTQNNTIGLYLIQKKQDIVEIKACHY